MPGGGSLFTFRPVSTTVPKKNTQWLKKVSSLMKINLPVSTTVQTGKLKGGYLPKNWLTT